MYLCNSVAFLQRKQNKIWAFSNENIALVCDKINFEGEDILGIGGAGDQALSFLASGAKSYYAVDSREKAVDFLKIKKALVGSLNYEDFIKAFKNKIPAGDIVARLDSEELSEQPGWLKKLDFKKGFVSALKKTRYFYNYSFRNFKRGHYFPYLKKENYRILQNNLSGFQIKKSDLQEELRKTEKKYKFVFFSNILDSAFKNQIYLSDAAGVLESSKDVLTSGGGVIVATLVEEELKKSFKDKAYKTKVLASPRFRPWVYLAFSNRYPYSFILARK